MKLIPQGAILNNRYRVGELLGEGGSAAVYEAIDLDLGITVALKVLKDELSGNKEQIEMLCREAEAMRGLHHPNIVKVYGIGHFEGLHYIAMEKIDGVTLDELIAQGGALQWTDCVDIIKQVLAALCYTHYHGVIHKDIKPQNILIDEKKHATLTDFGIAAHRKKSQNTVVAADGACSVYYMSPEQVVSGITDKRSDIYSLGITFYEMLVGAVPFDGKTDMDIALMHTKGNIIPACLVDESIPRAVSDIVVIATMKNPDKRFQTAEEMLEALLRAEKSPFDIIMKAQDMVNYDVISLDSDLAKKENVTAKEVINEVPEKKTGEKTVTEKKQKRSISPVEKIFMALTYIVAIIISGVIVVSFVGYFNETMKTKSDVESETVYVIEDYAGYKAEDVVKLLKDANILCDIKTVVSDIYPSGYILNQGVLPGTELKSGDRISISVIAEEGSIALSDFVGKSIVNARQILENSEIKIKEVPVPSTLGTGIIIKTIPYAGSSVEKGSTVTVYVSDGTMGETVVLPDFTLNEETRYTLSEAKKFIESMGLKLGGVYPEPGTDLELFYTTPTPEPTEEPTETPEPSSTENPEPTSTENPTESEEQTASPSETPGPTSSENPSEEPFSTENQDESGEPMVSPSEEPTPTPTPFIASEYVIDQYPKPGTSVLKGSYVDLYFYSKTELDNISLSVETQIERPSGESIGNIVPLMKFVFELSNGEVRELMLTNVDVKDFPLKVSVPFSWGSYSTKMTLYVNDLENVYLMKHITRTDEQMMPTPTPTPAPTVEPESTEMTAMPSENPIPTSSVEPTASPSENPIPTSSVEPTASPSENPSGEPSSTENPTASGDITS